MSEDEFPREDELASRQGAALYPLGRALRTTFDAENHDTLGTDLTGLMLELARIEPEVASATRPIPPAAGAAVATPSPSASTAPRAGWWRAVVARLLAR